MEVVIKELNTFAQFEETLELQDKIWKLSDKDKISTITLKALSMKYPVMGLLLGAYIEEKMVGFLVCMPSREPNTLLGLILGVLPQFENQNIGEQFFFYVHKYCLNNNISKICWTFEPLESKNANFYINKAGAIVVKYELDYYHIKDELNKGTTLDRFIVNCNPLSNRVIDRIRERPEIITVSEALAQYPVATPSNMPDSAGVLVKIPSNFRSLKDNNLQNGVNIRMETRQIFDEYINKRGYYIFVFLLDNEPNSEFNYYLLEKRSYI